MPSSVIAEYIWIDGTRPTPKLRSKTKILQDASRETLPLWSFDGSSTQQATGDKSDCILRPVHVVDDPVRKNGSILVMCEVLNADMSPHCTNFRTRLADLEYMSQNLKPWIGFEQEYTLFKGSRPLGFPSEQRFPAAQGPYYCGVGADEVAGRALVERHMQACIDAGLSIQGVNAEVMPGQWEFQIGGPEVNTLRASDEIWIARWLLYRLGEDMGISATLDPKPVPGDWNGAGMHANFSTAQTRERGGLAIINHILQHMRANSDKHIRNYGHGYETRLTGAHETCRYDEFRVGISDRTASIRIPVTTFENDGGYFEDRRPNANADPYRVSAVLLEAANLLGTN